MRSYTLFLLRNYLSNIKSQLGGVKVIGKGYGKIKKNIRGTDNVITIGKNSFLHNTEIRIRGNRNKIIFGENCQISWNCSFWMEGDDITIEIGDNTSFNHSCHLCAQEDGMKIIVGNDCMFSNTIVVRTSDGHGVYSQDGARLNVPKSVVIGNHVWIAANSTILKGVIIEDGAVVGSHSLVTKNVAANTIVAGCPAILKKENVVWTRTI